MKIACPLAKQSEACGPSNCLTTSFQFFRFFLLTKAISVWTIATFIVTADSSF